MPTIETILTDTLCATSQAYANASVAHGAKSAEAVLNFLVREGGLRLRGEWF